MIENGKVCGEVAVVVCHKDGTHTVLAHVNNRVANEGCRTYAQLCAQETAAATFITAGDYDVLMALSNSNNVGTTALNNQDAGGSGGFDAAAPFVAGSLQAPDTGYPKVNDDDAANPITDLANKLTYRVTYVAGTGDFSGDTVQGVVIVSPAFTIGSYQAGSKILAGARLVQLGSSITWPGEDVKIFVVHDVQSA